MFKKSYKFISILLSLMIVFSAFGCFSGFAAESTGEETDSGTYDFTIEDASRIQRYCAYYEMLNEARETLYDALAAFSYEKAAQQTRVLSRNSRAINREYKQKLVMKVVRRYLKKLFLPLVFRRAINACLAAPRIWRAARKGKIPRATLQHNAIGLLRGMGLKMKSEE